MYLCILANTHTHTHVYIAKIPHNVEIEEVMVLFLIFKFMVNFFFVNVICELYERNLK